MRGAQAAVKQDKLFRVQGDMKKDMQAQLAQVLDAQKSSQEALLTALAARPCGALACVLGYRVIRRCLPRWPQARAQPWHVCSRALPRAAVLPAGCNTGLPLSGMSMVPGARLMSSRYSARLSRALQRRDTRHVDAWQACRTRACGADAWQQPAGRCSRRHAPDGGAAGMGLPCVSLAAFLPFSLTVCCSHVLLTMHDAAATLLMTVQKAWACLTEYDSFLCIDRCHLLLRCDGCSDVAYALSAGSTCSW